MSLYYLENVRYVAHVHFLVHNGEQMPVEIGISSVVPGGTLVRRRESLLVTIKHPELKMSRRDMAINSVATKKTSTLPVTFREGGHTQLEGEEIVVRYVGDGLTAVKGESAKRYFESIGLDVVEIHTKIAADCSQYRQLHHLAGGKIPYVHSAHRDPWQCSRVAALLMAKFLEMRWKEEFQKAPESEEEWGPAPRLDINEPQWWDEDVDRPQTPDEGCGDEDPIQSNSPQTLESDRPKTPEGGWWDDDMQSEPKETVDRPQTPDEGYWDEEMQSESPKTVVIHCNSNKFEIIFKIISGQN